MSDKNKIMPKDYLAPIPIPPGETIKEIINELNMSQKELAVRLGTSTKHLSLVLNGKAEISREFASKLEHVLGIESLFWVQLENEYRESLKKITPPTISENEELIARGTPYAELAREGFVETTKKISEKILNLRTFFGVSDLNLIPEVNVAFRKANLANESEYALAAWIRIAEIQAKRINTEKFNRKKLIKALPRIRELTQFKAEFFYDELVDLLSSCGIALVFANHLKGTGVHGITFINSKKNKLIIQLSVRRKYADTFWFTLFHEIAHIVTDESESFLYLDYDEEAEKEIDRVAGEILIPKEQYEYFIENCNYKNYLVVEKFAKSIKIHPCIVIGRLQYDKFISYKNFVDKKPQFKIENKKQ